MRPLKDEILSATSWGSPMYSIYTICKKIGNPQQGSRSKFYVRVYRACEQLVDEGKMSVMRGTHDPSVYFNMSRLTN